MVRDGLAVATFDVGFICGTRATMRNIFTGRMYTEPPTDVVALGRLRRRCQSVADGCGGSRFKEVGFETPATSDFQSGALVERHTMFTNVRQYLRLSHE